MAAKFTVRRVTGEGEQIDVEVQLPEKFAILGPVEAHKYLQNMVYGPCDIRLAENSHRILDAMQLERQVPPELRGHVGLIVRQVINMIYGRAGDPTATVNKEAIIADREAVGKEKARLKAEGVDVDAKPVEHSNVVKGPWEGSGIAKEEGDEPA